MIAATFATINPSDKHDKTHIGNEGREDDEAFWRFVRTIKKPSWRQRTGDWREKYIWLPLGIAAFYAVIYVAFKFLEAGWHSLFG